MRKSEVYLYNSIPRETGKQCLSWFCPEVNFDQSVTVLLSKFWKHDFC